MRTYDSGNHEERPTGERTAQSRGQRAPFGRPSAEAFRILGLQRTAGNAAVARLLMPQRETRTVQRCGPVPCDCPPEQQEAASGPRQATSTIVTDASSDQDTQTATPTATITRTVDGDGGAGGAGGGGAGGSDDQLDGGLPPGGTPPACKSVSGTANLPSGTLPATVSGSKLGASWSMSADFTSDPPNPAACGPCGEYRQYVRGTFTKNGNPVTHRLCGGDLDPGNFQEDCVVIGGTQYKYGYHSIAFATSKFSRPDQATGQRWDGYDAPGITGSSGDTLAVNLDFQGTIIDTCNGTSLGGSTWNVSGTAKLP